MRVLVLRGSPRKDGNSATLTNYFLKGLMKFSSHYIDDYFINELNISPCQGCLSCATSENHECKIKDDMQDIYSAYHDAELVVFVTPMYWGYMTAQLKIVMDRMESLAWEYFYDKTLVIIITYRHHFESTVGFFERIAPYFRLKLNFLICCTYIKEKNLDIPVSSLKDKLEEAYQLGVLLGK
jgi:multimeric flavodoxin WrbA